MYHKNKLKQEPIEIHQQHISQISVGQTKSAIIFKSRNQQVA
jgi:hypothetical protein